eukprot:UN23230
MHHEPESCWCNFKGHVRNLILCYLSRMIINVFYLSPLVVLYFTLTLEQVQGFVQWVINPNDPLWTILSSPNLYIMALMIILMEFWVFMLFHL